MFTYPRVCSLCQRLFESPCSHGRHQPYTHDRIVPCPGCSFEKHAHSHLSQIIPPLPKGRRGRPPSLATQLAAAAAAVGSDPQDGNWEPPRAAAAGGAAAIVDYGQLLEQQQQPQQQLQEQPPPYTLDPDRLNALAVREQQLSALQMVRFELENLRLLADQVHRREKLKHQVSVQGITGGNGCCAGDAANTMPSSLWQQLQVLPGSCTSFEPEAGCMDVAKQLMDDGVGKIVPLPGCIWGVGCLVFAPNFKRGVESCELAHVSFPGLLSTTASINCVCHTGCL